MSQPSPHDRQLACGTPSADLLEQVAEDGVQASTAHQASCPFCQAMLGELERSWEPVQRLRSEEVVPSPRLLAGVMRRVRAGLETWYVELGRGRGVTRISNRALASIAYEAASAVAGVAEVRRAQPRRPRRPVPDRVDVELELAIAFGSHAPTVAAAVREAVITHLRELTSLEGGVVQISVTDVSVR